MQIELLTLSGATAIVTPRGRLVLGDGTAQIRHAFACVTGGQYRTIFLDLTNVPYIDCAGLGELVRAHTVSLKTGVELIVVNPTKRVTDLLILTKLVTIFRVQMKSTADQWKPRHELGPLTDGSPAPSLETMDGTNQDRDEGGCRL